MKTLSILSLLFISFLSLFTAAGCTKQAAEQRPAIDPQSLSYLALGDSYTIGESVGVQERFPAQTVSMLRTKGIKANDPQYIARTGWTTGDLLGAISKTVPRSGYDLVSLLAGVNDQYQGLDTAGYRIRFTRLLETSIQLAGNKATHVFVLSIPDYGVTPFGGGSTKTSKEIDAFNTVNKQITLAYNVTYIDITAISREAAQDPSLTAGDGLHPSAKQYRRWAETVAPAMLAVIR